MLACMNGRVDVVAALLADAPAAELAGRVCDETQSDAPCHSFDDEAQDCNFFLGVRCV
jgi:hypothetical protein